MIKRNSDGLDNGVSSKSKNQTLTLQPADQNLLFGILAVQLNFIGRDALIEAMNAWVLRKSDSLGDILVREKQMRSADRALLDTLVEKHLEQCEGDFHNSFVVFSSVNDIANDLSKLSDPEVEKSIALLRSTVVTAGTTTTRSFNISSHDGRFQFLRPHREGGLGSISVAYDRELNREVALKQVHKRHAENPSAQERLKVEAEITGGLEHPGIVPVYGLSRTEDGTPFYCMRFIRGDSLKGAIEKFHATKNSLSNTARNLELRNLLRSFVDVCDAVGYAHSRKVLHRDLKPGNIMLGNFGETLVVDWGLAKATSVSGERTETTETPIVPRSGSTAAPTLAGSALGTPEYMSPEQAKGRINELGPATDVYSLGATLYCLLVGKSPIAGENESAKLQKVIEGDFPKPRTIDHRIAKPLEAICLKAMSRRTEDRYSSPLDLSRDVECWLADEPVSAFDEPIVARAVRTVRKNRAAMTTIATGVAVAIAGLIGMNMVSLAKNIEISDINAEIHRQNHELNNLNLELANSEETTRKNLQSFKQLTMDLIRNAEKELSQKPEHGELRAWLTKSTLTMFREFKETHPESEWISDSFDSDIWLARLFRYEANNNRNNNQMKDSHENLENATSILTEILAKEPENPMAIGFFSETLRDVASSRKRSGQLKESQLAVEQAIDLSNQLLDKYPDSLNSKKLKATNLVDAGALADELGSPEQALIYVNESVRLWTPIVENGQANVQDRQMLIFALIRQAICLRQIDEITLALKAADEAIDKARQLPDPQLRTSRHLLARGLLSKARVLMSNDVDDPQTNKILDEAIRIWEPLAKDFPDYQTYKKYLSRALLTKGIVLSKEASYDAASQRLNASLELARDATTGSAAPDTTVLLGDILVTKAELERLNGDTAQASILAKEAVENYGQLPPNLRSSTRVRSKLEKALNLANTP